LKGYVAFWKYDTFPYVLSGYITKMREDGSVETEGYGKGHWFMPFKILPPVSGGKLQADLKILELQYRNALLNLQEEWVKKRNALITVPKEKA
jgi:hypothetical protein